MTLQCGIDTVTTDNGSWSAVLSDFPRLDFHLTFVGSPRWSVNFPMVLTTRHKNSFRHVNLKELVEFFRRGIEAMLILNPLAAIIYRWIQLANDDKQQRSSKGEFDGWRQFAGQERDLLLTTLFSIHQYSIEVPAIKPKRCEFCSGEATEPWIRGSTPEAVVCDAGLCQTMLEEAKEKKKEEKKEMTK